MREVREVANHLHFRMSRNGEVVIHNNSANTVNRWEAGTVTPPAYLRIVFVGLACQAS